MKLIGLLLMLCLIPPMEGEVINNNNNHFGPCHNVFLNNLPITPPAMGRPRYQQICQLYGNFYRYATLYDTQNKIPVYSAYHYTGFIPNLGRRSSWWIEPELDVVANGKNAAMNTEASTRQQPVLNGPVGTHQALNDDYIRQNNPQSYQKGHLYPVCENCDRDQADSTFTLTNAAPQEKRDNIQWFHQVEKILRDRAFARCTINIQQNLVAYVVTGVIPGNNVLNGNVRVPSHYWAAFCCRDKTSQNNFISEGYVKVMNGAGTGQVSIYGTAQGAQFTFAQLNQELNRLYGLPFQVFGAHPGCS